MFFEKIWKEALKRASFFYFRGYDKNIIGPLAVSMYEVIFKTNYR